MLVATTNSIILMMIMIGSSFHYGCDCWLWWSIVLVQCRTGRCATTTMTRPRCIVVRIVVLHSCSCCCQWRTVVFAITLYCCILFFVLFFLFLLFLLLLLLSVVCRQRLLLCRRLSSVICHPLAPSCCYHGVLLFRLFRVVSHCVALFRAVVLLLLLLLLSVFVETTNARVFPILVSLR